MSGSRNERSSVAKRTPTRKSENNHENFGPGGARPPGLRYSRRRRAERAAQGKGEKVNANELKNHLREIIRTDIGQHLREVHGLDEADIPKAKTAHGEAPRRSGPSATLRRRTRPPRRTRASSLA